MSSSTRICNTVKPHFILKGLHHEISLFPYKGLVSGSSKSLLSCKIPYSNHWAILCISEYSCKVGSEQAVRFSLDCDITRQLVPSPSALQTIPALHNPSHIEPAPQHYPYPGRCGNAAPKAFLARQKLHGLDIYE